MTAIVSHYADRAAPTPAMPAAVGTSVARGHYLTAASAREPFAVLGAAAAQRLGIDRIWPAATRTSPSG